MTKSEARAIHEGGNRALREMNQIGWNDLGLTREQQDKINERMKKGRDEVERIVAMASAEIDR